MMFHFLLIGIIVLCYTVICLISSQVYFRGMGFADRTRSIHCFKKGNKILVTQDYYDNLYII